MHAPNSTHALLTMVLLCAMCAGCGKDEFDLDTAFEREEMAKKTQVAAAATATLKGKISLEGDAPAPGKVRMDADPVCKMGHAGGVVSDSVIVGPDGALQNVFVYIKEGVLGSHPTPKDAVVIDQVGCMYKPHVFGVQAGQPIRILNSDNTLHNVHALPKKNSQFNLAMPFKGMELTKMFKKPEAMVKFKCDVHPWMSAFVGVMDHPFFATTGSDGTFELPTLPPGQYVLEAWHEVFGTRTKSVTLEDKKTKSVSISFQAPS